MEAQIEPIIYRGMIQFSSYFNTDMEKRSVRYTWTQILVTKMYVTELEVIYIYIMAFIYIILNKQIYVHTRK